MQNLKKYCISQTGKRIKKQARKNASMLCCGVGGRGRISKLQPFPADGKTGARNVASMDNDLLFIFPLYQMIAPFGKGNVGKGGGPGRPFSLPFSSFPAILGKNNEREKRSCRILIRLPTDIPLAATWSMPKTACAAQACRSARRSASMC